MIASRPTLGDLAPNIELADSRGNPWRLADQRGTTVVLIFHRHIH